MQIRKDVCDIALSEKNQDSVHHQLTSVCKKKVAVGMCLIYLDYFWKNMQETHQQLSQRRKTYFHYIVSYNIRTFSHQVHVILVQIKTIS